MDMKHFEIGIGCLICYAKQKRMSDVRLWHGDCIFVFVEKLSQTRILDLC